MMSIRIMLWGTGVFILLAVLIVIVFCLFLTVTEYKSQGTLDSEIHGTGQVLGPAQKEFTFLTWNIGYAGLGKEMDFFYDGGKKVIPEKSMFLRYLQGIKKEVNRNDTIDFLFIQEVDLKSRRAYYTNELNEIALKLPGFSYAFGKNYDCWFVPLPYYQPMGYVKSGIATFSRFVPDSVKMVPFGTYYPWPKRLFLLKRCYLVMKYPLGRGKELIVINTHNSAYDSTGELRKNEFQLLSSYMLQEYAKGNFVVTGGDWNSNPYGFHPKNIIPGDNVTVVDYPVAASFFPGWQFVFDSLHPSNRFTDMPYEKGKTRTTLIDFFVVSPNIEVKSVKTILSDFEYSDHQPVVMKIRIKDGEVVR
ncbi:MAG: hypothetical protein M0Q38_00495 [Bacteroidales bacterium]|nr:hypothetical protein [Bacteroidales bacterium]